MKSNEFSYENRLLTLVMIITIVLHLFFFFSHPAGFFNLYGSRDAEKYHEMAIQLVEEGIYGYNSTSSNAYVTPGHPVFLFLLLKISNIFGIDDIQLIQIINMLLSILTVFIIFKLTSVIFKNKWVSFTSSLLYSTYLSPLHSFRTLLTETPAIFMLCLSILIFSLALEKGSKNLHILFGIIASITIMFRPAPAPLLLLAFLIVIQKEGIRKSILIGTCWLIGPLIIILPWVIRNLMMFGQLYVFSSHSGNPLLGGTNPYYLQDFSNIVSKAKELNMTDKQYALLRIKEGFSESFNLWASWFIFGKTIELFREPWAISNYYKFFSNEVKFIFFYQHILVVVGGMLTGIFNIKNKVALSLFFTIIGYILISNMFITEPRFGFYIIPVLCILCGYGLVWILGVFGKSLKYSFNIIK